jgi:transmembrane sensor
VNHLTAKERRLQAAEDAANWLVALQSDELSTQERSEFIDWLRESPLHVSEMLHACRLRRDLGAFDKWSAIAPLVEPETNRVIRLLPHRAEAVMASPTKRLTSRAMGLAACVLGAAILSSALYSWFGETTWQTQLGERREVTLADGSIMDLAPASKVRVRYESKSRLISLDRGEALFHVTKDPNRPFIVQAARTKVRAVGTIFNVEHLDQGVSITVVEGRVTVSDQQPETHRSAADRSASTNVSLGVDEQVLVSSTGRATPIRKVKGEMEVAWAAGQLIFDDELVAEIVRRFNLYNRVQIRVTDPQLANRRVGGMFRATDPDSFIAFVESAGGVSVQRPSPDVIILGRQTADNGAARIDR